MKKNKESGCHALTSTGIFMLFCVLSVFVVLPFESEAAFTIYLENGRVISEVHNIKKENETVTIYKHGVMFSFPMENVKRIEEYVKMPVIEGEEAGQTMPAEGEIPEYLKYGEQPKYKKYIWERRKYEDLKQQRKSILEKLEKIENLETKIKELEDPDFRGSKARRADRYKNILLERLADIEGKDSLLMQKKQLEIQIKEMESE